MRCKVLIPFIDKVTGEEYSAGDEIELAAERIPEVLAVNINMVSVLEDKPEPKKTRKKSSK